MTRGRSSGELRCAAARHACARRRCSSDRISLISTLTSSAALLGAIGAHHLAQAADDLAGAQAFGADLAHRLAELGEVRLRAFEIALAGARVGGDRGQRLVDLVRHARGHFAHGRETRHARQPFLRQRARLLAQRPFGDVERRSTASRPELPSAARRAMQRQ